MNGYADSEWSSVGTPQRGQSVAFCDVVTVFLFDQNRFERRQMNTKQFDGRSSWETSETCIEDFLILSAECSRPVSRNRARCYGQHWDDLEALVAHKRSGDSGSDDDALWLMEQLPCDADL